MSPEDVRRSESLALLVGWGEERAKWLRVKKETLANHRFWSIFPFTHRVFKVPFFLTCSQLGLGGMGTSLLRCLRLTLGVHRAENLRSMGRWVGGKPSIEREAGVSIYFWFGNCGEPIERQLLA